MHREALRRPADAAAPFGLRVERTPFSELPDLVLLRPSDGLDVARLRYCEDDPDGPMICSIYLHEVSAAEEAEIDAHIKKGLRAVIAEVFSYRLWAALADPDPPVH